MEQPLDLCIKLNPPPAGASPETIASIQLRCDQLGLQHEGDLLADPLTTKEREQIRWYLEEYVDWPYEQFLERGKKIEALFPELGKRLYHTVFGSAGAMSVLQAWRLQPLQPGMQRQISIASEIPRALSLPWELLHDEQGFLVLRTRNPVSLIRRLPQSELGGFQTSFKPPLRILMITARPDDAGFIDPRSTARELLDEVQGQVEVGNIALEFLRPPTLRALRTRLSNAKLPAVQVLHFDGHGVFGEKKDRQGKAQPGGKPQGMLAFEDDEGKLDLVEANDVAQVLQDSGVRLAVLDACQSALGAADDAFSSVATRLIQGGVDAVVAMSASLLVASSTLFFEAFYRELVAGAPAPIAQERARQALHDDPRRHLLSRRRDEEAQPVELRDWWLPHYYQQRLLALQATGKLKSKPKKQPAGALPSRLNTDMPPEPCYGFSGRSRELLQVERHLLRSKLVAIHGFGGVGKTALVREASDWLTRTGMYIGACFVSFEHGGDSAALLSTLGAYLGVYDGHYNPNDKTAALARLKPALKGRPTLVIADNLESILPGGEAPVEAATRTQLWDVLLELAKLGAGVLLTTRDTNFGDGRLSPGKQVAHLALGGLYPEDAYTLASRLLVDLQIDRARASYADLRDLLQQLDYHPLAIQLVLPALRTTSLATIRADFAKLLPRFVDDTETGRNRSLLASLDYSLQRLSEEQRNLLPRLALFEGGASENNLLAITEIPEAAWGTLRPALEQAALLIAEHIHDNVSVPFLRFHPVLAPYLRSQAGADDAALRECYTQRYSDLADYLSYEDNRNPHPVRALVRKELPNLRRALDLLLEVGDLDVASEMAENIAKFLNNFGLLRERDELRRRMNVAVATKGAQEGGGLTYAEWLRESGLGEDEITKGNLRAAYTRFTKLLARIEALPAGTPLGNGSYERCSTLHMLARCLRANGQPAAAEGRLREALNVIDALIRQQPDHQSFIRQRGFLLVDLGDALVSQGKYSQAREAYESALKVAEQQADLRPQAVGLTQLGSLALEQRDYAEARSRYTEALKRFRALGEPASEAVLWHQLGRVAEEQKEWAEAERCYRESLAIKERLGAWALAATTCNQLAIVAKNSGRPDEAEGWYKQALELDEQVQPGSPDSTYLNNLADLLVNEVRASRAARTRLAEAKGYAERALAIIETLDASSEIWTTLYNLAKIADLEGQAEAARDYRRRERETFAAFEGNRYHINRQHGHLIAAIVAAAKGNAEARARVEARLPQLEEAGWKIAASTRRIWAGERDWHALVEDLDRQDALLVLRVLETIAQPTPEEVIAALPAAVREALESGDEAAFRQALEALSPEEQQGVLEAMRYLEEQAGSESGEGDEEG
jgi:tetratricopeptide (TPR) repeat protein